MKRNKFSLNIDYKWLFILIMVSLFSILFFYALILLERNRLKVVKINAPKFGFNLVEGSFKVDIGNFEGEFYPEDSIRTASIDITDKITGSKIIGFEIDFIPGKYRWICNSYTNMKNYQNGKSYPCNDVLKSYFSEKIRYSNTDSKKLQAILSVGLASQEGVLDVQEQLADNRGVVLYDAVNEYLDTEKLKIPTIKLSFGQYTGKSTDRCDEKTDEQRIVAFIRVYDSNTEISNASYASFQKMFYEVYEIAFRMNKIPLNGLNYSRFQSKNVFLERRFL